MIKAKLTIDNGGPNTEFDATPFFELASQQQLDDLKECNYRGNYAADAVAEFCREIDPKVEAVFKWHEENPQRDVGFEVEVNQEDAEAWLAANPGPRTERIEADDAIVRLTEFLREVADLDDLAKLMAQFIADGPVQVYDENGDSEVFGTTDKNEAAK